jgi:hypothetical protein
MSLSHVDVVLQKFCLHVGVFFSARGNRSITLQEKHSDDKSNTRDTSCAPEPCRILLGDIMTFVDIDCLDDSGANGQRNTTADLICGVDLPGKVSDITRFYSFLCAYGMFDFSQKKIEKIRGTYHATTQTLNMHRST